MRTVLRPSRAPRRPFRDPAVVVAVFAVLVAMQTPVSSLVARMPGSGPMAPTLGADRAAEPRPASPPAAHSLGGDSLAPAQRIDPRPDDAPSGVPVDGAIGSGSAGTGAFPYGGDYDPLNQLVYVANQEDDNVTVFNGTTGEHVTDIAMTSDPLGAAYVSWNRLLYVTVEASRSIEVVNTSTNQVNTTIHLAGDPEYVAYDPDDQELYVTVWQSYSIPLGVQVVNTSTNTAGSALRAGFDGPYCLAVDTGNNTVWVENLGNDSLTVLAGSDNEVVGWVHPGPQPTGASLSGGIVYASAVDQMFVVNYASVGTVNIFNASSYRLVRSGVPVGAEAFGASATYDPASERVYVASYYANTTTVISVVNDSVAAPTLPMTGGPWVGIYDPTTGALFFLLSYSSGVAWIFGGIAAVFVASGLAAGTSWGVSLNGTAQATPNATLSFVLPVGTAPYTVAAVPGYALPAPGGNVTVPTSPVAPILVEVTFQKTFDVEFDESGLPSGASWSVRLGGTRGNGSAGTPIDFQEPNGNYTYDAWTLIAGFEASINGSGQVTVANGPVQVQVIFAPTEYGIRFQESGLATGTNWWVNVSDGTSASSDGLSVTFEAPNGSYLYTIASALKTVAAPGGIFEVQGGPVSENVSFLPVTYSVTFTATGLPPSTTWSVTLAGITESGAGALVFPSVTNGSDPFTVGPVTGYNASPRTGTVDVDGRSVSEAIAFVEVPVAASPGSPAPATFLGLPAAEGYGVAVGAVALLALLAVGVVLRRRRPKTPPSSEP